MTTAIIAALTAATKANVVAMLPGAPVGKRIIIFVDDLNMPKLDTYGSQPPIELLRQYQDFGGLYDRDKLFWKEINVCFKLFCLVVILRTFILIQTINNNNNNNTHISIPPYSRNFRGGGPH